MGWESGVLEVDGTPIWLSFRPSSDVRRTLRLLKGQARIQRVHLRRAAVAS